MTSWNRRYQPRANLHALCQKSFITDVTPRVSIVHCVLDSKSWNDGTDLEPAVRNSLKQKHIKLKF